jgi:hypothetical protein
VVLQCDPRLGRTVHRQNALFTKYRYWITKSLAQMQDTHQFVPKLRNNQVQLLKCSINNEIFTNTFMFLLHKCFSYILWHFKLCWQFCDMPTWFCMSVCLYTYNCSVKLNNILYCRVLWKPVESLSFCLYWITLTAWQDNLFGLQCARALSVQLHFISLVQSTCTSLCII